MKFMQIIQFMICSFFIFSSFFMLSSENEQVRWSVMSVPAGVFSSPCLSGTVTFNEKQMYLKINKQYIEKENKIICNEVNNIPQIEIPLAQISHLRMSEESSILCLQSKL